MQLNFNKLQLLVVVLVGLLILKEKQTRSLISIIATNSAKQGGPIVSPTLLQQVEKNENVTNDNAEPVALSNDLQWKRYREVYRHVPPTLRDGAVNATICGTAPEFETYFTQANVGRDLWRSANEEDKTVYKLFPEQFQSLGSEGHYIELGAFDGLAESNTRFFDECLGWTGLLIEGNPVKYDALVANRPHAHRMSFAPSCSIEEERQNKTVQFHAVVWTNAGLEGFANDYRSGHKNVDVPCGTLTPVIQDVMGGHVHFFSLDVEGSEPLVLENIDFSKVQIDVIIAESHNGQCPKEPRECATRTRAREIMKAAGYKRYANVVHKSDLYIHPQSKFQLSREPDGRRHLRGHSLFLD